MIVKNHTIELKDTSASEMARFRQIMLGIWSQQKEDDKNSNDIEKFIKKNQITSKTIDSTDSGEISITNNSKSINAKDSIPDWIEIVKKYNNWIWWNFTIKSPNNNFQYLPFDARGYELYSYWAIGSGKNLKYTEGHWGDYMRDNHYIEQGLKDVLITKASIMKEQKTSKINIERYTFSDGFEIENGYFTGYEMLHGTNRFTIVSGIANYNKKIELYTFDLKLQWKDRINPNAEQGDSEIAKFIREINLDMPADFDVEINWSQKIKISLEEINNYNKNNTFPEADNRRRR